MRTLVGLAACTALLGLVACQSPGEESSPTPSNETPTPTPAPEAVDLREPFEDPPAGGIQFVGPDMIVPAYQERMFCYFFDYTGPDTAINYMEMLQAQYGHHAIVLKTDLTESQFPNNELIDCTDPYVVPMDHLYMLFLPIFDEPMEPGFGSRLDNGDRLVLQLHYVNPNSYPIEVQDAVNFGLTDPATVVNWIEGYAHNSFTFELPANRRSELRMTCSFESDVYVNSLLGHMHEWGTRFRVVWNRLDGSVVTLYDYKWKTEYRDAPPIKIYENGIFQVKAGESFTTICEWDNDTDTALAFPQEMCASTGLAYPLDASVQCNVDGELTILE